MESIHSRGRVRTGGLSTPPRGPFQRRPRFLNDSAKCLALSAGIRRAILLPRASEAPHPPSIEQSAKADFVLFQRRISNPS